MLKLAFVAALEREIKPLVRNWRVTKREHAGRCFTFFEHEQAVLVCGGIGAEAARRATEAMINFYAPQAVQSVGFAGALEPLLGVGALFAPGRVIDASDGSSIEINGGKGVLVTFSSIATPQQKAKLAKAYGAHAVDMEAAAVAHGAHARGVNFMAVKAISDESDFAMPALERFITFEGQFRKAGFAAYAAAQPWLWPGVIRLARNGAHASRVLCQSLREQIQSLGQQQESEAGWHIVNT